MRVRVSVANLGPIMTVPCGEVDSRHIVGILNSGSWKKGKLLIQPIGGAVELTEAGRQYLIDNFGAENFHKNDARFEIDEGNLADAMAFFSQRDSEFFEIDPLREIREELSTSEFPANEFFRAIPPILTPEEAEQIKVDFWATAVQPFSDLKGESPLAKDDVPSRRLFHFFDIVIPTREMYEKITASEAITELSGEEVATTNGGRQKGKTEYGRIIADNFMVNHFGVMRGEVETQG